MKSKIEIDHRETSEIVNLLQQNNIHVEVKQLISGDYIINNHFLIERKTARDFIVSIVGGRLFYQCRMIVGSRYQSLFLIEGSLYEKEYGVGQQAIQGAITSICTSWQIPILYTNSTIDTSNLLVEIAQKETSQKVIRRKGNKPRNIRKRKLYILQGLPGIGRKSANILLQHFGNVEKVFSATMDDLRRVKGIGRITAERIRHILTEIENEID